MQVLRAQNPALLAHPHAQEFIAKVAKTTIFAGTDPQILLVEVAKMFVDPSFGVFIAIDQGKLKGLVVVSLPKDALLPVPQIPIFYAEGKGTKEALIHAGIEWGVNMGYNRFWAINISGRSDALWQRAFERAGSAKRVGSIMEFAVG